MPDRIECHKPKVRPSDLDPAKAFGKLKKE